MCVGHSRVLKRNAVMTKTDKHDGAPVPCSCCYGFSCRTWLVERPPPVMQPLASAEPINIS
eukprot:3815955-Amphidinium_carterae.1